MQDFSGIGGTPEIVNLRLGATGCRGGNRIIPILGRTTVEIAFRLF